MGIPHDLALSAVRLSVGRYTTEEDINRATEMIAAKVGMMRGAAL
jgi:cysteine desulfurase